MMTKTLILFLAVNLAFSNAVLRNLKIGVPPKGKPQNGKTKLCASACPDCVQCDTKKTKNQLTIYLRDFKNDANALLW